MLTFENAELTLVPCRLCPRSHLVQIDQNTSQVLAYHGFGIPMRSGEPLPRAFERLLDTPCSACQRVRELDHNFIIARLPAHDGGETHRR